MIPSSRAPEDATANKRDRGRDEPVQLGVTMATLADGKTIYVPRTQLDAKAKGVTVVVENSGYRRMTQ